MVNAEIRHLAQICTMCLSVKTLYNHVIELPVKAFIDRTGGALVQCLRNTIVVAIVLDIRRHVKSLAPPLYREMYC